jgi:hypothetical protein
MKNIPVIIAFITLFYNTVIVAQCTRVGDFIADGASTPTSGSATLVFHTNGMKQVTLGSNFSTSNNGPDLHVILCKTNFYTSSTDLIVSGVLSQIAGSQTFTVPSNVQLTDFQYVLIHCVAYNHRFGYALLGSPSGLNCATLNTVDFNEKSDHFNVFPNPTSDVVNFSSNTEGKVSVYDFQGKKIISDFEIGNNNNAISLQQYPKGVYLIEINSNDSRITKKIIKK